MLRMIIVMIMIFYSVRVGTFKISPGGNLSFEGSRCIGHNMFPHPHPREAVSEHPLPQLGLRQKASFHYFSDSLGRGLPSIYPQD